MTYRFRYVGQKSHLRGSKVAVCVGQKSSASVLPPQKNLSYSQKRGSKVVSSPFCVGQTSYELLHIGNGPIQEGARL